MTIECPQCRQTSHTCRSCGGALRVTGANKVAEITAELTTAQAAVAALKGDLSSAQDTVRDSAELLDQAHSKTDKLEASNKKLRAENKRLKAELEEAVELLAAATQPPPSEPNDPPVSPTAAPA